MKTIRISVNNPNAARDILVNAMLDEILEEIYRQTKHRPMDLKRSIAVLCEAIEEKTAPYTVNINAQIQGQVQRQRDATITTVAQLIIMALGLECKEND
jgi:hypothetical protein